MTKINNNMKTMKNFFSKNWFNNDKNLYLYIRVFFAKILDKILSNRKVRDIVYCHTKYVVLDWSKLDYTIYEDTNLMDIIAEETESQIY